MKRLAPVLAFAATLSLSLPRAHGQDAHPPEGEAETKPAANDGPPPLPAPSGSAPKPPTRTEDTARATRTAESSSGETATALSTPRAPLAYPCWPPEIEDFNEEKPVPAGYVKVARVRKGMIFTGIPILAGFYALSVLTAIGGVRSGDAFYGVLTVPLVGPFITSGLEQDRSTAAILFLLGLAQVSGATLTTLGFVMPKQVLVREELAKGTPRLTLQPLLSPSMTGLAGTF